MTDTFAPEFLKLVDAVVAKSPLQKKKLQRYLDGMDSTFFRLAEEFARDYGSYLSCRGISFEYAVDAYLNMCKSMLACQIEFMKTGTYSTTDQREAFAAVYDNRERMQSYMIALALSQFLWPTHYRIYRHFERCIMEAAPQTGSYLEIGPGHGLYLRKAIQFLAPATSIDAVDISPASIEITRSIIGHFHPDRVGLSFWTGDVLEFQAAKSYDFVTMGEVLEHVEAPEKLLRRLAELLSGSGRGFVTTSINSPAVDHVYHFKTVDEVRSMIAGCGLKMLDEQVLPVEDLPMEEVVARRITVNYSAVITKG